MIKMCWGVPVVVTPEDGRFEPTPAEVEERVSSSTKAILLNSPNNPSGWLYSEEFVAALVDFCERRDIYLIMDDIYHKLVFDGRTAPPAYKYTSRDVESTKVIVINGISKLYGMTGFRIGWAVAPRPIAEVMTNVQAQTTSCTSVILQAAAEGALNGLQGLVEGLRVTMQNNRDVIVQELRSFTGVKLIEPRDVYAFPDFRAYKAGSVELASFAEAGQGGGGAGQEFGMEGHIRLSFAVSVKDITESIAQIKWALDPNSPNEIYIGDRKLIRTGCKTSALSGAPVQFRCAVEGRDLARTPSTTFREEHAELRSGAGCLVGVDIMNNLLNIKTPAEDQGDRAPERLRVDTLGLTNLRKVYWNLRLRSAVRGDRLPGRGRIAHGAGGGEHGQTRAARPGDKFIVKEPTTEEHVWWGQYNRPFTPDKFDDLFDRMQGFLQGRDLFVQDCPTWGRPGAPHAHPHHHRTGVALVLCRNMFILPKTNEEYRRHVPDFTVLCAPSFQACSRLTARRRTRSSC